MLDQRKLTPDSLDEILIQILNHATTLTTAPKWLVFAILSNSSDINKKDKLHNR